MKKNIVKRVAVFCGASLGKGDQYIAAARQLARVLVNNGVGLVYGGSRVGTMGVLAEQMLALDGEVIGIMPQTLIDKELAHPNLSQFHVVSSMQERKQLIIDLSDGFVMFPGGYGTLDEFFEVVVLAQLGMHHKPCGILNVNNYFQSLLEFLEHSIQETFSERVYREMILVNSDAEQLIQRFFTYEPPKRARWDELKLDLVCPSLLAP